MIITFTSIDIHSFMCFYEMLLFGDPVETFQKKKYLFIFHLQYQFEIRNSNYGFFILSLYSFFYSA